MKNLCNVECPPQGIAALSWQFRSEKGRWHGCDRQNHQPFTGLTRKKIASGMEQRCIMRFDVACLPTRIADGAQSLQACCCCLSMKDHGFRGRLPHSEGFALIRLDWPG
ncbi:hypothetical protein JQ557_29035 [Bradyrhizobium sp. U87765 SZCCT0131]|uniref:hypothetical protein n=1 Tax=unclassified Bradyrhizobium TaxID=2631580 RepID=UPI001BA9E545|nr:MULTISPECIES: hypothetical protein [unclassified Bradyrhizobium]MBR1222079.1 hypothetical protein [Bradyrhizobium sp. U87765 SZCCT0131]MBR1263723.1 hypothetical protein [Bradyrhizobium sp. U87765 SZCCT0134]MBR1302707.1 hypothetical protein [Bradyrhizobium sp. U87765 SZCCT0110]MBR1319973.1 hypothetical protein [Bradyrhizobium sp. U87765 SZCCT0109]MBR1348914.1 hypothetical protein [Bradyrhizobium sp. U87765 SZCCT0048]